MDMSRTMHRRRKAVRKLLESFPNDGEKSKVKDEFTFPPPPDPPNIFKDGTDTSDTLSDHSSVREENSKISFFEKNYDYDHGYRSDGSPHRLPPIGVFWDIENCQIPHGKSAILVAQALRERFFNGFREAEFVVVCDVKKESPQIIQELNDAQVNLIHVASTSKNAADEKLRQSMRRFADIHGFPAAIILISGDINFASDLCDLRHRKKLHVILLHNSSCSIALILCAHEHYNFEQFVMPLPSRGASKGWRNVPMEVLIWNLPKGCSLGKLKERLKYLSYNCGGRISFISESLAVVRFPSFDSATRAYKRMNGEIMFGNQIGVSYPQRAGTLKKETSLASNGQYGNLFSNHMRSISQSDQYAGSSLLFGNEGIPSKYLRSSSLQENLTKSPKAPPVENPWIWETSKVNNSGNTMNGVTNKLADENKPEEGAGFQESLGLGNHFFRELENRDAAYQNERGEGTRLKDTIVRENEHPWSNSKSNGTLKKCRTPSPYLIKPKTMTLSQGQGRKSFPENFDSDKYFNPIHAPFAATSTGPIELHITNLDQSIEPMEMKKILLAIFGEHVMVLHISVFMQSDGNFAASIRVPSIQDAQYAISQLHRRKIGYKRIMISYAHSTQPLNPQFIRWQVVTLLQDVPGFKLPLFKFLKMFESRYVTTISVSDLYRLKDVCVITEESAGRMVSLNPDHRNTPSPSFSSSKDVEPYCSRHYRVKNTFGKGWAEQEVPPLPNVNVPLKEFSSSVVRLIATHNNALPLSSFVDCHEAECGPLSISENGVPLEHLVTCVNKVELASVNSVKFLKPAPARNFLDDKVEDVSKCVSPSLVNQLTLFGRELVDLLRTQHHCQLIFNRLIPAYHHHFGRQCRVADYGFTKLIDLLDALPNIAQVIGDGNKRVVTLSHRAQIRRFTSDLLRALKAQPCKKLTFEDLPQAFERVLGKPFDPVDYGLCTLSDLIDQVPEATVVVSRGQITTLSIPKREQTQDEVERTKQFAKEVVELLGHAPQCSILFHQFIPAYHHHYGHQCRVADFGFAKLIELFEAIPDIVELGEDSEGERKVTLTQQQKLFVVGEQICDIVIPTYPPGLPLEHLGSSFLWHYGYTLKPQTYGLDSLENLINAVDTVKMESSEFGGVIIPVEEALVKQLMSQVKKYLIHSDDGKMKLSKLVSYFSSFHASHLKPSSLTTNLPDAVLIKTEAGEPVVYLTEAYQIGRRIVKILNANNGHMSLSALESAYSREQGGDVAGQTNLASVLASLPSIVTVKGKAFKRHVILNKDLVVKKDQFVIGKAVCRPSSTSALPSHSSENPSESSSSKWFLPDSTPVITLPEMETLPDSLLESASLLISPCKGLLPPSARPPHPSQVPIPDYLSPKIDKNNEYKSNVAEKNSQDKELTPSNADRKSVV